MCGEEHFSDWKGTPSVLSFTPPAQATYVSAYTFCRNIDFLTEKVRLPGR